MPVYVCSLLTVYIFFFFFNDTATTEIYTLSLHDALPILAHEFAEHRDGLYDPAGTTSEGGLSAVGTLVRDQRTPTRAGDRKSTRLNSSHANISYAVFCLKKKKHEDKVVSE